MKCCQENDIDIIVMDFPHMFRNLLPVLKKMDIPVTVQQHNIEYLTMRSLSKIKNMSLIKRLVYYLESKRLEWYEKGVYKRDIIRSFSFFSETDKVFFENKLKVKQKCEVIPLGANTCENALNPFYAQQKNIMFVGKMSGEANTAAAVWYTRNVFPIVKNKIPEAKLYIVGAEPGEEVKALANDSVIVTGGYDKPDSHYENSMLVIVPVFNGGGVKGKLLEAVSFKRPIVATVHGIGGTKFKKDIHVKVSDDIQGFAEQCIDILSNPMEYREMVEKAYDLFICEYTWTSIGVKYENFLQETINGAMEK